MGAFKSMPVRKEVSEISAGNWSPSGAQRRIDLEACKLLALTRQEEIGLGTCSGVRDQADRKEESLGICVESLTRFVFFLIPQWKNNPNVS